MTGVLAITFIAAAAGHTVQTPPMIVLDCSLQRMSFKERQPVGAKRIFALAAPVRAERRVPDVSAIRTYDPTGILRENYVSAASYDGFGRLTVHFGNAKHPGHRFDGGPDPRGKKNWNAGLGHRGGKTVQDNLENSFVGKCAVDSEVGRSYFQALGSSR